MSKLHVVLTHEREGQNMQIAAAYESWGTSIDFHEVVRQSFDFAAVREHDHEYVDMAFDNLKLTDRQIQIIKEIGSCGRGAVVKSEHIYSRANGISFEIRPVAVQLVKKGLLSETGQPYGARKYKLTRAGYAVYRIMVARQPKV